MSSRKQLPALPPYKVFLKGPKEHLPECHLRVSLELWRLEVPGRANGWHTRQVREVGRTRAETQSCQAQVRLAWVREQLPGNAQDRKPGELSKHKLPRSMEYMSKRKPVS